MPPHSVFSAISPSALLIRTLFVWILILAAGIFAVVAGSVTLALVRFRARAGVPDPLQQYGVRWIEMAWTLVPLGLLVVIFVFTVRVMVATEPSRAEAATVEPDLIVVGHQWWWEARYPKSGAITANEIHCPVGTRWLVRVESADVIHDFWVPSLGPKVDAVPGHPNYLWLAADAPGTYLGTCSEYCGAEHAWMRIRVMAQTRAEFDRWVDRQAEAPAVPDTVDALRGAHLFEQQTCVNCHRISGTRANAAVGPDLTHVASRTTLAAGVLTNTPEHLIRWLENPQAIKPAARMPDLHLSRADAQGLTAYLETLK